MKVHKKVINGLVIKAYNDSNSEWVVSCEGFETVHRFDKRKWSMKNAIDFVAELSAQGKYQRFKLCVVKYMVVGSARSVEKK